MMMLQYHNLSPNYAVPMPRGGFHRLSEIRRNTTVVCERGVLWLTQSGDPVDHVLLPGQRYTLKRHGKVLIEALREASLRVVPNTRAI
jgi:hypothetical protein